METRLKEYEALADKVVELSSQISAEKQQTWYQLVEYPLRGAAEMNKKHLYAQLARHGLVDWRLSNEAFDSIVAMTEKYNSLNSGKWNRIMDYQPRRLAVYQQVPQTVTETPFVEKALPLCLLNGQDYVSYQGVQPVCYGLGYQRGAIHLEKGTSITYEVNTTLPDSIAVTVALAPNHPVEGTQIRYAVSVDEERFHEVDYHTVGRSEEWKENVLNNQAIRTTHHKVNHGKRMKLTIKALDEGVVVDQIKILSINPL